MIRPLLSRIQSLGFLWKVVVVLATLASLVGLILQLIEPGDYKKKTAKFRSLFNREWQENNSLYRYSHNMIPCIKEDLVIKLASSNGVSLSESMKLADLWYKHANFLNGFWSPMAECIMSGECRLGDAKVGVCTEIRQQLSILSFIEDNIFGLEQLSLSSIAGTGIRIPDVGNIITIYREGCMTEKDIRTGFHRLDEAERNELIKEAKEKWDQLTKTEDEIRLFSARYHRIVNVAVGEQTVKSALASARQSRIQAQGASLCEKIKMAVSSIDNDNTISRIIADIYPEASSCSLDKDGFLQFTWEEFYHKWSKGLRSKEQKVIDTFKEVLSNCYDFQQLSMERTEGSGWDPFGGNSCTFIQETYKAKGKTIIVLGACDDWSSIKIKGF